MYCDQEILMDINGGGKWAAFNLNGGYHQCSKKVETKKPETMVVINQQPRPLTLEELQVKNQELEARIKRLEGMLIGAQK